MSKKPPALYKGDTIGIMAPSSRVKKETLLKGIAALEARGFNVYVHPQTWKTHGQFAGTPKQKASALHDLYKNPDIKAIFCARGGNGAGTVLEHLDYDLIRQHPKILMGFSDATALLAAVNKKTGQIGFHGPVVNSIGIGRPYKTHLNQCFNLLSGQTEEIEMNRAVALRAGVAQGRLVGGNLSVLCSLLGTPWQPDLRKSILFIEDINEEYSAVHRMLQHLRNTGTLEQVGGILLGQFMNMKDTGSQPFGFTLADIVREVTAPLKVPVALNVPFGHGKDLYTLPIGAPATLAVRKGGSVLTLDAPAVSV